MTDAPPMSPTAPGSRLVTVDDLRYELQRERAITDAHFMRITSRIDSLDRRFEQVDARFDQIDKRFDQVDSRFAQVDSRFDRLEARFDVLEERLRFNKTLIVASLSAVASVASVVVSLLK
jgi:predicted nuclease with TOPRIM domain